MHDWPSLSVRERRLQADAKREACSRLGLINFGHCAWFVVTSCKWPQFSTVSHDGLPATPANPNRPCLAPVVALCPPTCLIVQNSWCSQSAAPPPAFTEESPSAKTCQPTKQGNVPPMLRSWLQVTLGQKKGQAMRIVSRCLWDTHADASASEFYENETLYCVCQVCYHAHTCLFWTICLCTPEDKVIFAFYV